MKEICILCNKDAGNEYRLLSNDVIICSKCWKENVYTLRGHRRYGAKRIMEMALIANEKGISLTTLLENKRRGKYESQRY